MPTTLSVARVEELDAIPGLVHGFERRRQASVEAREATRQRVAAALSDAGDLFLLTQVHGATVRQAPWPDRPPGDAAVAEGPGLLLGIETADCLPVLLVDPRRQRVGAAHAGWRGTAAGVARAAVRALADAGSPPQDLLAALGPAIGPCCYEVGHEVRAAFGPPASAVFREGPRGRPHLDVRLANVLQLREAGLRPERIWSVDECTRCRADLYHSFRRDGKDSGRMISFVGFRR